MITLRPIRDEDQPFLRGLYASTRADEMALVEWTAEEIEGFLDMQFLAQHTYYTEQFPDAQFDLVLEGLRPIGRLYVDRRETEHRLIDIALIPESRGRGVGGRLLDQVLAEAAAAGKVVRIHVEQTNPAMRLYDRLGFTKLEEQGIYDLLEWRPPRGTE